MASESRIEVLERIAALATELCVAVDRAEEDIGGSRSINDILGDIGPLTDAIEKIPHGDMLNGLLHQATGRLRHIHALEDTILALREKAEKWDALRGCARLRIMGCAGLHEKSEDFKSDYAHIGLELWTKHDATGDPSHVQGLEWFDKFMIKALRVYKESRNGRTDQDNAEAPRN